MTCRLRTLEEIIKELGEPPLCQCEGNCGQRIKISPKSYPHYKHHGYPKYIVGHTFKGKKRPEHSEAMKGQKNPMFGDPREDLQIKFKGENNPMFGKSPWNKNKPWSQEIKDKISKPRSEETKEILSQIRREYHKSHPDCQSGDKNPMKNPEFRKKCSESMKEYYRTHPDAIKRGEEHWSYGKPSPKLHMFSALDHLIKDKYCRLFTPKLKEEVRQRDNYICQNCGTTQNGKKHSVHHIHYDKTNCYPDLITLCNHCNLLANHNRNYWEFLFMNKLNDRHLLFWTTNRNKEDN